MTKIKVVVFSGGRGSQVLSKELISHPRVELTLAVNGYDDGKSTGEVRRFLGDCLGPSDFRKNASTLAQALRSCAPQLIELLDLRFPDGFGREQALPCLRAVGADPQVSAPELERHIAELAGSLGASLRGTLARKLRGFEAELAKSDQGFSFSDCSLGNLVFAGCYLEAGRRFNTANDDYCALLGLPRGCIENVSDGINAYLVALDRDQRLLASEAEIVDSNRRNYIEDIYLVDRRIDPGAQDIPGETSREAVAAWLEHHSVEIPPNERLLEKLAEADLILYAPGTQHSSLLPSYLTLGIGAAIARNLAAIKILVTNLQEDAEIPGLSALGILEKALYYLRGKNRYRLPTPCLITHCLLNDASGTKPEVPYVPLGRLHSLEDPRLVRIANYEEGWSGRHDAGKVLTPFIESLLARGESSEVAVLLLDAHSTDKIYQTLLEALRGGIQDAGVRLTFFYACPDSLDLSFVESLPFRVTNVWRPGELPESVLHRAARNLPFQYVMLFESSGMYRGEDIVHLLSALRASGLDAVWGSRRLSTRQVRESYKLRYRHDPIVRALSYVGSHGLSLLYLLFYGRYVSDTLSGARVLRSAYLDHDSLDLTDKCLNQHLLSMLLRDEREIFETPVAFFSMSPEKVKRTSVLAGLQSILTILSWRFRRRAFPVGGASAPERTGSGKKQIRPGSPAISK